MKTKHTPTPLEKLSENIGYGENGIESLEFVGYDECRQVECAVNSHEALLEAAKRARESLHNFLSDGRASPYESPVIDELDQAIAQAEKVRS